MNDIAEQPKTLSVPDAGMKYFELKRHAAYAAARRGDIPVIKIGRYRRVPVAALERISLPEVRTKKDAA